MPVENLPAGTVNVALGWLASDLVEYTGGQFLYLDQPVPTDVGEWAAFFDCSVWAPKGLKLDGRDALEQIVIGLRVSVLGTDARVFSVPFDHPWLKHPTADLTRRLLNLMHRLGLPLSSWEMPEFRYCVIAGD